MSYLTSTVPVPRRAGARKIWTRPSAAIWPSELKRFEAALVLAGFVPRKGDTHRYSTFSVLMYFDGSHRHNYHLGFQKW